MNSLTLTQAGKPDGRFTRSVMEAPPFVVNALRGCSAQKALFPTGKRTNRRHQQSADSTPSLHSRDSSVPSDKASDGTDEIGLSFISSTDGFLMPCQNLMDF